ncbi:MAG: hypothetical protein K2O35_01035 [Clostridia bacterium]|nr:hypothetical protein [Clostridia bacterium]
MKSFKSKKSKVLLTCLAVILTVSVLCVSLAGCKPPLASDTPLGVYFVGDFQRNVTAEQLAKITKPGAQIVSIADALDEAKINKDTDPAKAAAAIYAVAVTNYNNVTQTGYYVLTNAKVSAKGISTLMGNDVNVGLRSTYSSFSGVNGNFSQTVSGVTQLEGVGGLGDQLRGKFGYNVQSYSNADFAASRHGSNGGAQFPSFAEDANVYKYILGAYNTSLTDATKGDVGITPTADSNGDDELPAYVPAEGAKYPDKSTLAGKPLPSFNANRKPWEPLNRIPNRYKDSKGRIVEDGTTVAGTRYSYGNYGAGFAVYDFSRPEYLSDGTKVNYNSSLDLWTVEVAILDDYVNQACEFAAGDLIKDTQNYIALKNAKFTKISVKFEVYGNGLIKSMQKIDELGTDEKCDLTILPGTCNKGGVTSNTATMAFSYSDYDTDANRLAALYWPALGDAEIFKYHKVSTDLKLDLSKYDTFDTYEPKINEDLVKVFNDIFAEA